MSTTPPTVIPTASHSPEPPQVELDHLDHLWFQVAGTLCNLTCQHCFISCSPHNHNFGFVTLAEVKARLQESLHWGVKEYYFTGGEPFLNREMTPILIETLRYGPATVLTNATVLKDAWLEELRQAERASRYSLEFRVSIDGFSPETNDPIRGAGTFARAMRGVEQLVAYDFLPIITAARVWPESEDRKVLENFVSVLQAGGYSRPRIKILPALLLGAEEKRTRGYTPAERVTQEMLEGYDQTQLVCHRSRVITDRGVWVCPILLDSPEARLGESLEAAGRPYPLRHGACSTCYQHGAICSNPSAK